MNHDEKEEHDMFIPDQPIEKEVEDILGRGKFAEHLSNALLRWKEPKSIVIALCGEWGSGKSSIINLAIEKIEDIEKTYDENKKSIIIHFNPWNFSAEEGLTKIFFTEISKELIKKNAITEKVCNLMMDYGDALSEIPKIGFLFAIMGKMAEKRSQQDILTIKKEIQDELHKIKSIIIVIDDIDRLSQSEMKKIFRLIKVNADFPNTIYLLSFDKKIIEENLDVQEGVSGKDYMDKIVQVDFDVPAVGGSKVLGYLKEQIDKVIDQLPEESAKRCFSEDSPHWYGIHRGIKGLFNNLRDVKRFINGLKFNLLSMHENNVMEVNPVDFVAIEAIRIFAPNFYSFMKHRKSSFTYKSGAQGNGALVQERRDALKELLPKKAENSISILVEELFPQIPSDQVYYIDIGTSANRKKEMRVCDEDFFDNYFTLLPDGGEDKLTQFEVKQILHNANSEKSFEKILMKYIEDGRINNAVKRIGNFADDEMVPLKNIKHIVKVLFNISDNLSGGTINACYRFLGRENNKDNVLKMLKEIIPHSKGLYWPVELIHHESNAKSKGFGNLIVPEDKLEEIQKICVARFQDFGDSNFLKNQHLGSIMYRWREWDKEEAWKPFIERIQKDDEQLLAFVDKFISEHRQFRESLRPFLNVDDLEKRIRNIKTEKTSLYEKYKRAIDLYLTPPD